MNHHTPRFNHHESSECVYFLGVTSPNPETSEDERRQIIAWMEQQDRTVTVSHPSGGPKFYVSSTLKDEELNELTAENYRNVGFLVLSDFVGLFAVLDRFPDIFEQDSPQVVILNEGIDLRTWNNGSDIGRRCFAVAAKMINAMRRVSTIRTTDESSNEEVEELREKNRALQDTCDRLGFALTEAQAQFNAISGVTPAEESTPPAPPASPIEPVKEEPAKEEEQSPAADEGTPPPAPPEEPAPPVSAKQLRDKLRKLNGTAAK